MYAGNTSSLMHIFLGIREGRSIVKQVKTCSKTRQLKLEEELGENERSANKTTRTNTNPLPKGDCSACLQCASEMLKHTALAFLHFGFIAQWNTSPNSGLGTAGKLKLIWLLQPLYIYISVHRYLQLSVKIQKGNNTQLVNKALNSHERHFKNTRKYSQYYA